MSIVENEDMKNTRFDIYREYLRIKVAFKSEWSNQITTSTLVYTIKDLH